MTTVPDELVVKMPERCDNSASHVAARIAAEYYEPKIAELVGELKRAKRIIEKWHREGSPHGRYAAHNACIPFPSTKPSPSTQGGLGNEVVE